MSKRLLLGIGLLCGLGSVAILTRCLLADSPSLPLTNVAATPTSNGALSVAPDSAGGPARAATPGPMPLLLSGSVAPANAIAQPGLPESLTDRAFDKYVDARLLAKAVRTLDVGLLTDVALQMAEGERILLRPHKVCSSDDLLDLARRVAVDKGDSASLARLTAAATQLGKKDLLAKLVASKTTGTPSAAAIPAPAVSVEQTSIESFTAYKSLHDSLKHAMLLGDTTQLNGISQQLSSDTTLTNDQRTYLTKLADQAKASSPTAGDQTAANLRKLALSGPPPASPWPQLQTIAIGINQYSVWYDPATGLAWTFMGSIQSLNGHPGAIQSAASLGFGFGLPSIGQLQMMYNHGGGQVLGLPNGFSDSYETSDPNGQLGYASTGFASLVPRLGIGTNWVVAVTAHAP